MHFVTDTPFPDLPTALNPIRKDINNVHHVWPTLLLHSSSPFLCIGETTSSNNPTIHQVYSVNNVRRIQKIDSGRKSSCARSMRACMTSSAKSTANFSPPPVHSSQFPRHLTHSPVAKITKIIESHNHPCQKNSRMPCSPRPAMPGKPLRR
jgi:hypothetical protein